MHKDVPLTEIVDNPFQPRTTFDRESIQSLAEEIQAEGFWNGTLQGRRTKNGKVELVFGHRRLRALRHLKVPSVKIELVDLTDAQMALRSLEENLQREGLSELEKADAVRRAVDIEREARKAAGKPERGAIQVVAERLGLTKSWVSKLCDISSTVVDKERGPIQAGHLGARVALEAKKWGGDTYVKTLAQQGKQYIRDGSVPQPTQRVVEAMQRTVAIAPEPIRERLKTEIIEGKVTTPTEAEQRARRLKASHVRREKEPPPDLREVIVGWTHKLKDWEKEMRDVAPYMEYVEEVPAVAERFREALKQLIDTAKQLL